jgi:hypothetical protein
LEKRLSYYLLDCRGSQPQFKAIQELVYSAWKRGWATTYRELQSEAEPQSNEFLRQSFMAAIVCEAEVVGCHLYSFWDLHSRIHLENPYFADYPESVLEAFRSRGASDVMTMEYLYVSPQWRKSLTGISYAEILLSLALRILSQVDAAAAIGIARNDRKMNSVIYRKGAECMATDLIMHHVDVDIISVFQGAAIEDLIGQENDIFERLWAERIDPLGITLGITRRDVEKKGTEKLK